MSDTKEPESAWPPPPPIIEPPSYYDRPRYDTSTLEDIRGEMQRLAITLGVLNNDKPASRSASAVAVDCCVAIVQDRIDRLEKLRAEDRKQSQEIQAAMVRDLKKGADIQVMRDVQP